MPNIFKAESFISLNTALLISIILVLSYTKWQNYAHQKQQQNHQQLQAMQIAENQLILTTIGQPCEKMVLQNNIHFKIGCFQNEIQVEYPTGEFQLTP
ncbi:Uncharacterised protein [Phocoenobacter uteri]|uniref:DUF5374 domain-containing protein n=1 Tax=Phocoenobacter uteri TaxID=146806 RepID=A0A379CBF3_9PAST|nr:DUF5374 domain-containing protein [Phocoenobacter uteri]MDG6881440.1 hypothetical protein [Phocoenobacter uteri]SUB59469.1 Uncharacterised protein [Phocoenobacter uteri]